MSHNCMYMYVYMHICTHVGRALTQAVSRRLPTVAAQVPARVNSCGICGGQSDTGTGLTPRTAP
jgi:hypothetical protein